MKDMMIGGDLAKSVFQVHGALRTGEVQFRKKLTRQQFPAFMAQQEPCMVIFEACGGAHYWAREMEALGHDLVAAANGVIALAERIWPAFEHIDTSSGALSTAVRRTQEQLLPILIEAPADEPTRAAWLDRLRRAILNDGVDYLAPISDRFGEIAAFPALQNAHSDRDLDLVRAVWADYAGFSHAPTATLTFSCLLEAGRHEELLALLAEKKTRLWFDEKFGAEALLRQGCEGDALACATALLEGDRQPWGHFDIARFCENILLRQSKVDEAYRRFGLPHRLLRGK